MVEIPNVVKSHRPNFAILSHRNAAVGSYLGGHFFFILFSIYFFGSPSPQKNAL